MLIDLLKQQLLLPFHLCQQVGSLGNQRIADRLLLQLLIALLKSGKLSLSLLEVCDRLDHLLLTLHRLRRCLLRTLKLGHELQEHLALRYIHLHQGIIGIPPYLQSRQPTAQRGQGISRLCLRNVC